MAKKRANGEGSIRKRKDGRWEGRYTAGHDPETGKAIVKNVLGRTQAEVKEKLKEAGLEHIRFHDLRHTFATLALQNGVDVKTVSAMLGHSSAGFTLATYGSRQKLSSAPCPEWVKLGLPHRLAHFLSFRSGIAPQ